MKILSRQSKRSRTSKSASSSLKTSSVLKPSTKQKNKKKSAFLTRYADTEAKETPEGLQIFLPARLPGFNEAIASSKAGRGRFNRYAREKEEIESWICGSLREFKLPRFSKCKIGFTWVEPDRRRDIDNISAGKKYILDALVALGVLPDDSWKHVKGFLPENFEADKNNWGVKVEIREV